MRTLIFLSIALPIAISFGFTEKPAITIKNEPSYRILESLPDPTLGKRYAVFELRYQFETDTYMRLPDGQFLEYGVDNVYYRTVLDDSMKTEVYVRPGAHMFYASYKGFKDIVTKKIPIKPGYRTIIVFEFKPLDLKMDQPVAAPESGVK